MRPGQLFLPLAVLALLAVPGTALALDQPACGLQAMVASAHPAATGVGVAVLRDGGNAVDAAVAVAFALAVCEPYSSGLGGGGFLLTFEAESGTCSALDARETAPAAAHRDMFLVGGEPDAGLSRYGPLSVAVPGLVRGLAEAHRKHGSLPWSRLVLPARDLARGGITVSPTLRARILKCKGRFNQEALDIFVPGGQVPAVGDNLVQADLAATLDAIAREGAEVFYSGPIAASLAACAAADGRGLAPADLAAYRPRWREPVNGRYRGLDIVSMPPPSSGGIHLVQMLAILEDFDLPSMGFGSAASTHHLAEAMKFAFADRSLYLGDTDFVPVPVGMLLAASRLDSLRSLITPDAALAESSIQGAPVVFAESDETTHLSVVDGQGNAVAATLTINLSFGSGLVAAGTGVILNDEMDDFVSAPGRPNAFGLVGGEANSVAPGKRPLSSMTPTIVLQDGHVRMVTGSPGGSRIISATMQTIVNVVDHGMNALEAATAPRVHHQWYPARLYHEPFGMSPDTRSILGEWGHRVAERAPMGNVQIIVVDPESGLRYGASDPRGMGTAAGY
jgi:gamma-glutamyltranspeptidase/glutathione hydrolase